MSVEAIQTSAPDKKPPRKFGKRLVRFVGRVLLSVLFITITFALLLQVPAVQTWILNRTTAYLSKELDAKVSIDGFSIDYFDEISIRGIYVSNQHSPEDTLGYIGSLRADLSYVNLAWGIVQIDAARIDDIKIRFRRDSNSYTYNYKFLETYFNPPKPFNPNREPRLPDIRFGQLHLRNLDFEQLDLMKGSRLAATLVAADVHTNIMNLPNKILDLTRVSLHTPSVYREEFVSNPLPTRRDTVVRPPITYIPRPFQFIIGNISIENGKFYNDDWERKPKRTLSDSLVDFNHLKLRDITANVHNFMYTKGNYTGVVDGISLKESSGFVLQKLTVGDAKINDNSTELYGLQIVTPYSAIGDTLIFRYPNYRAFNHFNNEVMMDARIHASQILINDIIYFAPALSRNPFFVKNRNENARIEAEVTGLVNRLNIYPFDIRLGKGLSAQGTFRSRDLTTASETFIDLNLKQLNTTMPNLKQLIPNFKPSDNFNKLGNLSFNGFFLGFFNEFSTKGALKTDIGDANFDLTLKPDRDSVGNYAGNLNLNNFDIAALSGNNDFGKISLATKIKNGSGFKLSNVKADLDATVTTFQYRNYNYRTAILSGNLARNVFSGKLESRDPNADFNFDGDINFSNQDMPIFRFKSNIKNIDFKALNLTPQEFALSANLNLDLRGKKVSAIEGLIDARNIIFIKNKTQRLAIDSLIVKTGFDTVNPYITSNIRRRTLSIASEMLRADLNGTYVLDKIHEPILRHFQTFHPRFAADLGIKAPPLSINAVPTIFDANIQIFNTKNLTALFLPKLDTLKNIDITFAFNEPKNTLSWGINTKETHSYDGNKIWEFGSIARADGKDFDFDVKSYNFTLKGGQDFKDLTLNNHLVGDSLEINFVSYNLSQAFRLDTVELNAYLEREDSTYKLSFGTSMLSRLRVFGDFWDLDSQNYIRLGKKSLDIKGFDLRNGKRQITLESISKRGLKAVLNNFDIDFVNPLLRDDRFTMAGKYRIEASVGDIFTQEDLNAVLSIDSLIVKNENRGALKAIVGGKNLKTPLKTEVKLVRGNEVLAANGYYAPPSVSNGFLPANWLDVTFSLENYPFRTLQLLIPSGASDFRGRIDGNLRLDGSLKSRLNTNGELRVRNARVTVDYIKVPLLIKDERIRITNTTFDATGGSIYDTLGNRAMVKGGLTHDRFFRFGLNVNIKSNNFLCMNTTREDNSLYYGTGIGAGDITFTGDFVRTNMVIRATAGKGTQITFPFATEQTASTREFVIFKTANTQRIDPVLPRPFDPKGIDCDLELSFTPEAETVLIFDEAAGDNIRAHGTGDIHFRYTRAGDITMDGQYNIERGNYLFTLLKVVNKTFDIKRGGFIRWNGTPFDATISIDAGYKKSTAPYNFIAEYVVNDENTKTESRKATNVDLTLKLTGDMMKPDINFELAFPQTNGALQSYLESKMRFLRQDQNELNRQVFGLVVLGGFLPNDINNQQIVSGSINTLSETATTVLSSVFNQLIGEYVSGLDIQIGYNVYEFDKQSLSGLPQQGQEFRFRTSYAFDDRTTITAGVGVNNGNPLSQGSQTFVGGDFAVDYAITEDRRLKIRLSYTRDQVFDGSASTRDKPAIGIRFQREFDNFQEFLDSLRIEKKEKKDNKTKSDSESDL